MHRASAELPVLLRSRKALPVLLFFSFVFLIPPLFPGCRAEPETSPGVDLLDRMEQAEEVHSYRGRKTFLFRRGEWERSHTYEVTHWSGGGGLSEIVSRSERDGRERRRFVRSRTRLPWLSNRELLVENYHLEIAGEEKVAGREGTVLAVSSRHAAKRPSLRLVVDTETGLLLAATMRDWQDEVAFRYRFETIEIDPTLDPPEVPEERSDRWSHRVKGEAIAVLSESDLPFRPLLPDWLPAGFKSEGEHFVFRGKKTFLKSMYTDGLSTIEINQTAADEAGEEHPWRGFAPSRERNAGGATSEAGDEEARGTVASRVLLTSERDGVRVRIEARLDPEEVGKVLASFSTR